MATYTVAATTSLALSPRYKDAEITAITFGQLAFNLKRTTALTSSDYWRYQASAFLFQHRGTVIKSAHTYAGKGINSILFEPNGNNLSRVHPRQTSLSGNNSSTFTSTGGVGRVRNQLKNIGFVISHSNSQSISHALPNTGTSSLTITSSGGVRHTYNTKSGSSAIAISNSNSLNNGTTVTAVSGITFSNSGTPYINSVPAATNVVTFTHSNGLTVTKKISGNSSVSFTQGGYALV